MRIWFVAKLFRDIREGVVTIVFVEGATDGGDVGKTIVVVIDGERDAAACDAGLLRDILKGDVAGSAFIEEKRRAADEQIRLAVVVDIQRVNVVCL